MFIQTPMPRPLGDRFVLSIDLPTCEVPLELPAEVVRCVATGADRGMAVRFLYSGIAQQAFIEGQVAQLLSRS